MAVTIKDIARLANIDTGAVSRTLRNHPDSLRLRPETRERITRIARELGYQKNQLAFATRTGIVNTIAVIGAFSGNQFSVYVARIIDGILQESARCGFSVKVYSEQDLPGTFAEIAGAQIRHVLSICIEKNKREECAEFAAAYNLNMVFLYERPHNGFPSINVNDFEAGVRAVRHLAGLGHRRIGLICVPHNRYYYVDDRHDGYLAGMKAAGLEIRPELILCSDQSEEGIMRMLTLPADRRPSALFAIADNLAMLAERCALRLGLRLPEELSVIGIGNDNLTKFAAVPLSTVDESLQLLGSSAVDLLLKRDCPAKPDPLGVYRIQPKLLLRESVANPWKNNNIMEVQDAVS